MNTFFHNKLDINNRPVVMKLTKSTPRAATYVANPSFNQRSVHHFMVTRLPNHWWASSWAITSATPCTLSTVATSRSINNSVSLNNYLIWFYGGVLVYTTVLNNIICYSWNPKPVKPSFNWTIIYNQRSSKLILIS